MYRTAESRSDELREIEAVTADRTYASSYFRYNRFSYLYRFFESDDYAELEKNYTHFLHVDITKCFDSIYTHSISWAVKGIKASKLQKRLKHSAFDKTFDSLIQSINYQETNGIPIGPEMSRIFSEIILQRVDLNVLNRMEKENQNHGTDYCCHRYVDDVFFFFNEDATQQKFKKILTEELLTYKLHLNAGKSVISARPFITKQSLYKLAVSEFVSGLFSRLDRLRGRSSAKEIARLRSSCPFDGIGFNSVAAIFFSSLRNKLVSTDLAKYSNAGDILYVISDVALHAFRMDSSTSSSYKLTQLVLDILHKLTPLAHFEQSKITDKLILELRGAAISAMSQGYCVEAVNTLIALREVHITTAFSREFVHSIMALAREGHRDSINNIKRYNYFSIIGLIYVLGDQSRFASEIVELVDAAIEIIQNSNPYEHAESAILLMDLVSCPFISNPLKDKIIKIGLTRRRPNATTLEIATLRNFATRHDWFFNWNTSNNLQEYLKKKKLTPAY